MSRAESRGRSAGEQRFSLRPFRAGDEAALADICLRTANGGGDATGLLEDDDLWAHLFVLPYLARVPEFAIVVSDIAAQGQPVGYVVAAPDSDDFEQWFAADWWPRFGDRWPSPDAAGSSRQDDLLRYAYGRGPGSNPPPAGYPSHLHIDLLPVAQRRGLGRRLIAEVCDRLRDAGVPGLHVVPVAENQAALAFYRRLRFITLGTGPGVVILGRRL